MFCFPRLPRGATAQQYRAGATVSAGTISTSVSQIGRDCSLRVRPAQCRALRPVALADGGERDVLVPPPRGRATWRARRDRRGPPRVARERAARVGSAGQRRHHAATATPRRAESNHELDQTFYQTSTRFRRERRAHARAQAGQGIANRWPITRQTPALNRVAVAQQACAGAPGTGPGGGMAPAADAKVRGQGVRTSLAAMCDF